MRGRLSGFERRLARIAAWLRARADAAERARESDRAREKIAALIRDGLERAGLDPAEAAGLRRLAVPEPPRPTPTRRRPDPAEAFLDRLRALAARMTGPPPLATASRAELRAYYCCGDGAAEAPA